MCPGAASSVRGHAVNAEKRVMRKLVAVVVAVALVIFVGVAYFVGSTVAVGRERLAADSVLEGARQHNNKLADALQNPKTPTMFGADQDVGKSKASIDAYNATLGDSISTTEADLRSLRAADERLKRQSGNPLMWAQASQLAAERERVEAMISAFDSASGYLRIVQAQLRTVSSMLDAVAAFEAMSSFLERQDIAGALNRYPELEKKLQMTAELARAPGTPPQFQAEVNSLQTLVLDLKAILQAAQANDFDRLQSLQPKLDADAKALEAFDQKGFDDYETALAKPYRDRFEAGVRKAGFQLRF
jgi:hypothetical protein